MASLVCLGRGRGKGGSADGAASARACSTRSTLPLRSCGKRDPTCAMAQSFPGPGNMAIGYCMELASPPRCRGRDSTMEYCVL